MTVSVVMPVYNAADTVVQTLDSLRAQTHSPLEIIAVDDGSTDGTTDLLRQQRDIVLLERPHRGIVPALNDGLAVASGKYIARMDADDLCTPERMAVQAAFLDASPRIGLVGCRVEFGGDRGKQAGYAAYVDWINSLTLPQDIALNRFVESPFAHPSVMFRKELVSACGGYRDGAFPEDYELWLRWMDHGVKMGKVDETLLRWNDPPTRLSRTDERYAVDAFYRTKAAYLYKWLETNNPHHPDVMVWGAGRVTRRRAALLEEHGIRIRGYIDIKPRRLNCGTPVIPPEEIPPAPHGFIIPMVSSRGARVKIARFLRDKGYIPGEGCIFCG